MIRYRCHTEAAGRVKATPHGHEIGIDGLLTVQWVAWAYTAGAFRMLAFVIAHVYLTTTGHTVFAHIKAMITGYDEVEPEQRRG